MQTTHSEIEKTKISDMSAGAQTAVLMTVDADGRLDARPMACVQRDFDGVLWFMTSRRSHKLDEIKRNPGVLVSYADTRTKEFVVVQGRARIIEDAAIARSLWSEAQRIWFPGGPADPDLALISIEVEAAKYWTSPASSLALSAAYLDALFRGRRPPEEKIREAKKVEFDR
jgi:general stress protein 26